MSRIGIIGAGYWGSKHIRVFSNLINEGLISGIVICDNQPFRLSKYKNIPNVEITDNYNHLLKSEDVEFIDVVTPTPSHFPLSKEFLKAGKHVLVEKPMTFKFSEALELVQIADSTNKNLMVGHIFRFHSALLEIQDLIKKGFFGQLIHIDTVRAAYSIPRPDMGVLHALGIHDVDIACQLLDDESPDSIYCWSKSFYRDYPDEIASLFLEFPNGVTFSAYESWLSPGSGKTRELTLTGTRASAKIDFLVPDTIKIYESSIEQTDSPENLKLIDEGHRTLRVISKEPLAEELNHFIKSSTKGNSNQANGHIGARAVFLINEALRSLELKSQIKIDKDALKTLKF